MRDYRQQIRHELALAESSRAQGLEGRARVCARRAAGLVVRAYLEEHGEPAPTGNALELLRAFAARPEITPQARTVIEHLLVRVAPDYQLPISVDLIAETRRLADLLIPVP